jgi:hypothetical protein
VPQRVQLTRTSPNHSSTATHAGAAQVRHHQCPVKATTCTGEDTHWCNQRWCRPQLIRSNGSRPRFLRDVLGGEAGSEPAVAQSGVRLVVHGGREVSRQMVVVSVLIVVVLALASVAAAVSLRGPV